ncbi:MAG: hypothetical protein ACYTFY_01325 [Planctomycetota bacterium]|jgi:hypothetical protein
MAFIKAFLFSHGEKILLAVVAFFAIWSIAGNLMGDYSKEIKPDQINEDMEKIKTHLNSSTIQKSKIEILRSTEIVDNILTAHRKELHAIDGWQSFYVLPPKPAKMESVDINKILKQGKVFVPPEKYISRIGFAQELRVEVGGKRVVLIFRENDNARWLTGVRAKIFRKAVGYGQGEANYKKVHQKQLDRAGYAAVSLKNDENEEGSESKGMFSNIVKTETHEAGAEDPAVSEGISELEKEKKYFDDQETVADSDLAELLNSSTAFNSSWELVAEDLKPVTEKPDLESLLRGESLELQEAENVPAEEYQSNWFYFVDDYKDGGLVENIVYRYMVVLYARGTNVADEMLLKDKNEENKLKNYIPFVSVGSERLALNNDEFKTFIKKIGEKTTFAKAEYPEFSELVSSDVFEFESSSEEPVKKLWVDNKKVTLEKDATYYSQMSYSNYFLTPVRTRFQFVSKFGEDTAMMKVYVIDDEGKEISSNFTVKMPVLPPESKKPSRNPYKKYPLSKFKPAPIGGEKKVKGIIYDFSTGWGLVDIKKCEMVVKPYKLVTKKDKTGRVVTINGEEVKEKKYTSELLLNSSYLIIVELKSKIEGKKPRFMRKPKYRSSPVPQDVEYIWNPKTK